MMLLASNDIVGLRRLLSTAMRRGASPQTICNLLERSIAGLYTPRRGFTKRDLDIALLVKSIGGPRLLYTLQHSHGLPSWRTVRRHHQIAQLLPSIGTPSEDEISKNIASFFNPDVKPPPSADLGGLPGNVLMFDGIALETRCRWCPKRDHIIGLCREHSHNVDTKLVDFNSLEKIRTALFEAKNDTTKVCFGADATIVAVAPYARNDHYSPVPIVASPSDKTEKGIHLAEWVQTVLDTWKKHDLGAQTNGSIWALASDGDSAFRVAKHKICMVKKLDSNSTLGKLLAQLFGLNCYTSVNGVLWTGDPKHILKRFATLLRNNCGFLLDDILIRAEDIVELLTQLPDMTLEKAVQLLDPSDKQNVPKAVNLLQSLLKLKELSAFLDPTVEQRHKAIIFLQISLDILFNLLLQYI